jgi:hypothetical protein
VEDVPVDNTGLPVPSHNEDVVGGQEVEEMVLESGAGLDGGDCGHRFL